VRDALTLTLSPRRGLFSRSTFQNSPRNLTTPKKTASIAQWIKKPKPTLKQLRQTMTPHEQWLWRLLRNRHFSDYKLGDNILSARLLSISPAYGLKSLSNWMAGIALLE